MIQDLSSQASSFHSPSWETREGFMFLAEKSTGHMIEVLDIKALFDPNEATVRGSLHFGEEAQDPEAFEKANLNFPSGESLPLCWIDPDYRKR